MKAASGGGGYWIDPEESSTRPVPPPQTDEGTSHVRRPAPQAAPRSRHRTVLWTSVALVALIVVCVLVALVLKGIVVVPGLSAKLFPIQYQEEIQSAADKYDQDPYLVAAIVQAESGFDPTAVSSSGAVGLMQLMPATADWIASQSQEWPEGEAPVLTDPGDSLELGTWYLEYLGGIYGDGSLATLAAYNGGQGNVNDWIEQAGGLESFGVSDIQFPETRRYVERIEFFLDLFQRIHPDVFS